MLVDTHAHVQFQAYKEDRDEVIRRCLDKQIILNIVGTQKDTSRMAVELAEKHETLFASIGTHPIHLHSTHVDEEETSFQSREESFDWDFYEKLAQSKKVVGVGECGLDLFHLPKEISQEEVLKKQTEVFLSHVEFAYKHDLPLVIHCRDAHDQMIDVLRSLHRSIEGTVHCYTSHWEHAKAYLDLGLHLGFTGVITFPVKKTNPEAQNQLLDVVKKVPMDRMLIETDSPYLAAQAYRGKRCEPWMVEEVVKQIALVRRMSYEVVATQVTANALGLFKKMALKT